MTVCDILLEKHSPGQPLNPSALLVPDLPIEELHPVIFDQLTGPRATALKTEGSTGPSSIDAKDGDTYALPFVELLLIFVMH